MSARADFARQGQIDAAQTAMGLVEKGLTAHRMGRLDAAQADYRAALQIHAACFDARHLLGVVLQQMGKIAEALIHLREAAREHPDSPSVWTNLGNALQADDELDEALRCYRHALDLDAQFVNAWLNTGVVLSRQRRHAEALPYLGQAHRLGPQRADILFNCGIALEGLARLDEAYLAYSRALELEPSHREAHLNRANVLIQQGRFAEGIAEYQKDLRERPDDVRVLTWLANLHSISGERAQATRCFERVLELDPANHQARFDFGMCQLSYGEFEQGLQFFESRWLLGDLPKDTWMRARRAWRGHEDLQGRVVVLTAEQGFGDTLQFCRYVAPVLALGAHAILQVPAPLVRLLQSLDPRVVVTAQAVDVAEDALHCPLMSLPFAFETRLESIPSEVPYLHAPAVDKARWAERLCEYSGLKVGLVWAGAPRPDQPNAHATDRRRSLALRELAPLSQVAGVHFFSLQKGEPRAELASLEVGVWAGAPIIDWTAELSDFADTAALAAHLDLIISCDTSMVHLAGACAYPVWILSRFDGCWRWLRERDDSPWYPTARLFRQTEPALWQPVVERVARELQELAQRS